MTDPFQTLDLPPRFDLDLADLEARFLAASAKHHPDRYTDPLNQADAADRMADLTQAYRTLKDPEQRANALLAHHGGPAKEDDKSLPPTLLMEVMDIREELEEAIADQNADALDRLRYWAQQRHNAHETQIAQHLAHKPGQAPAPAALKAARLELNAMRYMRRMLDQIPDTP